MPDIKIAWGMTAYGPIWAPAYASHLRAIGYANRYFSTEYAGMVPTTVGGVGCTDRLYTHSAENQLVKDVLEEKSFTHLFMTEQDMILPHDTIPKLLEVKQPIVSGVYFLRNGNGQPCLYVKAVVSKENPYPHSPVTMFPMDKPFVMDGTHGGGCPGLGCVLIERRVFETIVFPWFDLKESNYGSDMFFYTKVRDNKIPVWVHPGVLCDQIDYTVASVADYHQRIKEDPKFAASGFIIGAHRG